MNKSISLKPCHDSHGIVTLSHFAIHPHTTCTHTSTQEPLLQLAGLCPEPFGVQRFALHVAGVFFPIRLPLPQQTGKVMEHLPLQFPSVLRLKSPSLNPSISIPKKKLPISTLCQTPSCCQFLQCFFLLALRICLVHL